MTKITRTYGSVFEAIMPKNKARKCQALSDALMGFRDALVDAGISEEKANRAIRSIKLSDLMK